MMMKPNMLQFMIVETLQSWNVWISLPQLPRISLPWWHVMQNKLIWNGSISYFTWNRLKSLFQYSNMSFFQYFCVSCILSWIWQFLSEFTIDWICASENLWGAVHANDANKANMQSIVQTSSSKYFKQSNSRDWMQTNFLCDFGQIYRMQTHNEILLEHSIKSNFGEFLGITPDFLGTRRRWLEDLLTGCW